MLRDLDALSDADVRAAFGDAVRWFADVVAAVPDDRWDDRGPDGRTARHLAALAARSLRLVPAYLDAPADRITFVGRTGRTKATIARPLPTLPRHMAEVVEDTLGELTPSLAEGVRRLADDVVARVDATPGEAVCATPTGAISLADLLPSRVAELTVWTLDLLKAVGADAAGAPPAPIELALAFVHALDDPVGAILALGGRIGYDVVT